MFTIDQIKAAHSKVKSGADFPAYIKDIKDLGVISYEVFVVDGHTNYYGLDGYQASSPTKYEILTIAEASNENQFKSDLKLHQEGKTDYPTFCQDAANSGIEKWQVDTNQMTCAYFDMSGKQILVEVIPG